jgi:hypothetical protein
MNSRSFDIDAEFVKVLDQVGIDPALTGGRITFTGEDPILPSKHRLGEIFALAVMACIVVPSGASALRRADL